jgi:Arylsulfotransferase (ASST)
MGWSHRPTGLIYYDPARAYRGYTLFSPNSGDDAYLIDMEGAFVHRWHTDQGISYGYLLPDGHLLCRNRGGFQGLPGSDGIQELSWEGALVWEYRNPALRRHQRLSNGNTLVLLYEPLSAAQTQQVQGGFTTPQDPERMQGDLVAEITPNGSVIYEWRSADHLDPQYDVLCSLEGRTAWGGANDLTALDNGNFLISFRVLDTVAMVDRRSSTFLWKWGRGHLSHQHHPTLLANGHVLLLDNGAHRRGLSYSRVIEVDPGTNAIAWEYHGDPLMAFFTHFTGGAERLPNGNTLICEGNTGRLFEVTPTCEIVWEYISPFFAHGPQGTTNGVFRCHRYGPDHPALRGWDLDPIRYSNFNRLYGGRH